MKAGATIEWTFDDVGAKLSVDVIGIEEESSLIGRRAEKARVTMQLEPRGNDATLVTINEAG
jgi:hypothetical protein